MIRRGFTLIEMLVATVLFTVLMTAVLFVVSGLSRDRAVLSATVAAPRPQAIIDLLRFDLGNAETMLGSRNGDMLVLVGHGGIHPKTLAATGRLSRITYRVEQAGTDHRLIREQRYVDDRAQPQVWREVVATNVQRLHV